MNDLTPHCYLMRIEGAENNYYKESVWINVPENKGIGTANISTIDHGNHKELQIELPVIDEDGSTRRLIQRDFQFDPEPGLRAVATVVNEDGDSKGKTIIDLEDADSGPS